MSSHLNPKDGGNALCLQTANKKKTQMKKKILIGKFVLLW